MMPPDEAATGPRHTPRQGRDTGHDKGDDRAATTPDVSRPNVLTVAQAARLLGVSARTVQRQCRAGKLRAIRLETEFGEQWELSRADVEQAATEGATTPRQEPRQGHDNPTTEAATTPPTGPRHVAPQAPDFAARYVAQIEAENAFLRAAVEQHQRSEAELRAALREALKAQPRQLEAPTEGAGLLFTKAPLNGIEEPEPTINNTEPRDTSNQTQKSAAQQKEPRPLWKLILGIR